MEVSSKQSDRCEIQAEPQYIYIASSWCAHIYG
jgi:hypothetical protein